MRFAAAMIFGLVLAAGPAKAQEGGILGLFGFAGEDKDAIEYLERPPLVVPKSNVLPRRWSGRRRTLPGRAIRMSWRPSAAPSSARRH